ncbi:hypothetical protein E1B28_007065 [Marasmius oreades]|uniref:Uncharacterized protein n=1 Tax=Marasmius oreades TaxID=181124 RepID=A0A9P7S0V3_9AGAR|nr:uncharacterized protein E1B28_007065 [Marasmius oreades]KAG7093384.1 hypothetical protein E1B28_007065 [Marasmius oreades]
MADVSLGWKGHLRKLLDRSVAQHANYYISRAMIIFTTITFVLFTFNSNNLQSCLFTAPVSSESSPVLKTVTIGWPTALTLGYLFSVAAGVCTAEGYRFYSLACVVASIGYLSALCVVYNAPRPSLLSTFMLAVAPHLGAHWLIHGNWRQFEVQLGAYTHILLMITLRMDEKDVSLACVILLPPIVSAITMSSALYLTHGTLGTYLLPFDSDLQVVHWEDVRSFLRSERNTGRLAHDPSDRDVEAAIISLAEAQRKAT